jgi:hypothetical protein
MWAVVLNSQVMHRGMNMNANPDVVLLDNTSVNHMDEEVLYCLILREQGSGEE